MPNDIVIYNTTALTATITLTSLSSNTTANGREGAKMDFGTPRADRWLCRLQTKMAAAATAGKTIEVWMGYSNSSVAGTGNPANLTGTDTSWAGYSGDPAQARFQLRRVGQVVLSNGAGTNAQVQDIGVFTPERQWGVPVVLNYADQALSSTAGDHVLTFTPIMDQVQ